MSLTLTRQLVNNPAGASVTDLFAGLGGSSEGLSQVPGLRVLMAANHWDLAMKSHEANHPNTAHDCADISQVDPRRYPRTDVLWASPECTNHSQARGKRRDDRIPDSEGNLLPNEAAERSRATMWDVPRFAERHQYRVIIVENVVDAVLWGTPGRQGGLFNSWLTAMDALGYAHQLVFVNSMHATQTGLGAPQSRDRLYVCFWRHGDRKPDFDRLTRPRAHCTEHGWVNAVQSWKRPDRTWGRYRAQYVYRCPGCDVVVEPPILAADTAIRWDRPARRLGDKPLAPKTMARIAAFLEQYGDQPGQLPLEGRDGKVATPTALPHRTLTTRRETGLIIPLRANNRIKRAVQEPFDTLCASGNHMSLLLKDHDALMECGFRMFENDEMKAAMGFGNDYIVLGTKREMQRLTGNAVCVPNARDIGAVISDALAA